MTPEHLILKDTGEYGKGVFARTRIPAGDIVLTFDGPIVSAAAIKDENMAIQISESLYLIPSGGFDDFVNHSCNPNCGLIVEGGKLMLKAINAIDSGDQITFDYSTSTNLADGWTMQCACGATCCRKVIGDFADLDGTLREKYLQLKIVPDFVANARSR